MRELSEETGVSVPTIKYYIREGLLEAGEPTAPNQAVYGEAHVRRLRLIRALREVGGLSIATIGRVLEAAGGRKAGTVAALGIAMDALAPEPAAVASYDEALVDALTKQIYERLTQEGWRFRPNAAALRSLAEAMLGSTEAMGRESDAGNVTMYSEPVMEIARREFQRGPREPQHRGEEAITWAVLGTVLSEPVILSLRRLAHEHLALEALPEDVRSQTLAGGSPRAGTGAGDRKKQPGSPLSRPAPR